MVVNPPNPNPTPYERTRLLIDRLLNRGYETAARSTLEAVGRGLNSGIVQQRLIELDAEAARLSALGLPLRADNPVLRALLSDLETQFNRGGALIDAAGEGMQTQGIDAAQTGVRQLALPGLTPDVSMALGIRWNTPDPEAINRVVSYTARPEFQALIDQYALGLTQQITQAALRGIAAGQNPRTTARELRALVQGEAGAPGLPLYRANTIMRTLQLTAYRDASVMHQLANADLFEGYQIRVATLDARTCMACVALHGTRVPLAERIDDHWNGRCVGVPVVRGRGDVTYVRQNGIDWFDELSADEQIAMMGGGAWDAWRAGAITLQDFVHRHEDALFGSMIQEASLIGMLGEQARQYYRR